MKQIYIDRFHSRYAINATSGCWEWTAGLGKGGYGQFKVDGEGCGAHRYSAKLFNLPKLSHQTMVLHSCDNPRCVNPSHLRWGTHIENVADKVSRNRQSRGNSNPCKGIKNGQSKLTEQQIISIRQEYAANPYLGAKAALGRKFNVTRQLIGQIIGGSAWKHIQGEVI